MSSDTVKEPRQSSCIKGVPTPFSYNNPYLNINIGKYHLPHIGDAVLVNDKTKVEVMTLGHNICQQGDKIFLDYIDTFKPVAIPSATINKSSASHKVAIPSATLDKDMSPYKNKLYIYFTESYDWHE